MRLGVLGRAPSSYDDAFMARMASAYVEQTPWTQLRLAAVRDLVEPRAGEHVLDLGSAGGAVSHFLSTFGCRVVGVDSELRAIETARALFPALEFTCADVADLPFADCSFDKAVAADLVEHLEDAPFVAMLAEVHRVLRLGGTLSIYTPNPLHPVERLKGRDLVLARNETHVALRSAGALARALAAAGFLVDRDEWRPSFWPGLRALERAGGGRFPTLRYRLCVRGRRR
ncbi:MAG: class I SAM-dependent methyltransferase [Thermoleophilia bacterium]|nr:class I SAM-dependent methyltransferase [Thermoleophilia bacterium]